MGPAAVAVIGVLALQGDVREHLLALSGLGVTGREVRRPVDLRGVDGLILPGGESTTLSMLLDSSGLRAPIAELLAGGLPAMGTCAGLVLMASKVLDGRPDQQSFAAVDCTVRRNGYGRQIASFEASLDPAGIDLALGHAGATVADDPLPAVFIRAPRVEAVGEQVEVLATLPRQGDVGGADPVVLRQGSMLVASFHPELTDDRRLHRLFVKMVTGDGEMVTGVRRGSGSRGTLSDASAGG